MKNMVDRSSAKPSSTQPAPRLLATFNEMDAVADTRYLRDKSPVILSRQGINTTTRDVARPSLIRSRGTPSRDRVDLRERERERGKKKERERVSF